MLGLWVFKLKLPEKGFWQTTPRKFKALMEIYIKENGGKTEEEANDDAFKQLMQMA